MRPDHSSSNCSLGPSRRDSTEASAEPLPLRALGNVTARLDVLSPTNPLTHCLQREKWFPLGRLVLLAVKSKVLSKMAYDLSTTSMLISCVWNIPTSAFTGKANVWKNNMKKGTYLGTHISHPKVFLSRWFSFSQGGICDRFLEGTYCILHVQNKPRYQLSLSLKMSGLPLMFVKGSWTKQGKNNQCRFSPAESVGWFQGHHHLVPMWVKIQQTQFWVYVLHWISPEKQQIFIKGGSFWGRWLPKNIA